MTLFAHVAFGAVAVIAVDDVSARGPILARAAPAFINVDFTVVTWGSTVQLYDDKILTTISGLIILYV